MNGQEGFGAPAFLFVSAVLLRAEAEDEGKIGGDRRAVATGGFKLPLAGRENGDIGEAFGIDVLLREGLGLGYLSGGIYFQANLDRHFLGDEPAQVSGGG